MKQSKMRLSRVEHANYSSGSGSKSGKDFHNKNVLSARHKKTDDLIEMLHRSLTDQVIIGASTGLGVQSQTLSGAVAPTKGRRRGYDLEVTKPRDRARRGGRSAKVSHLISKTQELVSLAEFLGIDMSRAVKNLSRARSALARREQSVAREWTSKANSSARDEASFKTGSVIRRTSASLRELESVVGASTVTRSLLVDAKRAHSEGDHVSALRLLIDARTRIKTAQTEALHRIIGEGRSGLLRAKKVGLNIDDAMTLINISRDKLRQGEFAEAVRCARESKRLIETSLDMLREARHPLTECTKAIALAETLGADVKGLNELLAESRRMFAQNDLQLSSEHSMTILEFAKKAAYDRAAESYAFAEKALASAKRVSADARGAEAKLVKAKELLERNELAKSVSMACASVVESDSAIADFIQDRLKTIEEFGKGIEADVDNLTEVQDGIESSKRRNLENLKKYADQTESIIGEAYECAAAYARVAQDIVKQAYESSIEASPMQITDGKTEEVLGIPAIEKLGDRAYDAKKQKLINLFLTGKVSDTQLDKLLLVIDSSVEKEKLV